MPKLTEVFVLRESSDVTKEKVKRVVQKWYQESEKKRTPGHEPNLELSPDELADLIERIAGVVDSQTILKRSADRKKEITKAIEDFTEDHAGDIYMKFEDEELLCQMLLKVL